MSGSQLETALVGPGKEAGTFLLTVHGIGDYDASKSASGRLVDALAGDLRATLEPVDFNWHAVVEARDFKDKVVQLSRSMLEAAHLETDEQCGIAGHLVRALGFVFEAVFKLSVLAVPLFALLLICAIPIYVRFGSVGIAGAATSFAFRSTAVLWAATGAIFAVGLMVAGLLRVMRRRLHAATLLRRMLLVFLQPVIPLAYRLSERKTRDVVSSFAGIALWVGLYNEGIRWWSGADAAAQWSGLGFTNLSIIAAGFAVVPIIGYWIWPLIRAPLKLARDIFNYIGDVGQRARIQDKLNCAVDRLPAGAHVILVGHSLGSVVALDSLCNSGVWARFESVSLVTAGSPIFRFFQRFFPGLFFPREAGECCSRIQSRSRVVRWLNVYRAGLRRGDPVGQALFAREGTGVDVPVLQNERVLMQAHGDYWDDLVVIDAVKGAWGRMLPPLHAAPERPVATPVWHSSRLDRAAGAAITALGLFAVLGLLFAVVNAFNIVQQRRLEARDFLARAALNGLETSAKVTHSTTTWGWGGGEYSPGVWWPVQVYEFDFVDLDAAFRRLTFRENEDSGFEGGLYFNSKALRLSLGREEYSEGKSTFDVRILYLPGDPSHLALADPRFRPVTGGTWGGRLKSGFPVLEVLVAGIYIIIFPMVMLECFVFAASVHVVATAILPDSSAAGLLPFKTVFFRHDQNQWWQLPRSIKGVDPKAELLDGNLLWHADTIDRARVLILPLSDRDRFSAAEIEFVKRWVGNGGGLLLIGDGRSHWAGPAPYSDADRHHDNNVPDMARAFGYEFADSLLMPRGSVDQDTLWPQAARDSKYAVKLRVSSEHEIAKGVTEPAVVSSCAVLSAGAAPPVFELQTGKSGSTRVPEYLREPRGSDAVILWRSTEAGQESVPVAVAFEAGGGRVVITGTWKLFTVDDADNRRFVRVPDHSERRF
jgi:hypothetical protein